MTIILHLVRHAQGFHNLNSVNEAIPDPYLTPKGQAQCAALHDAFPHHDTLTHLVASPMRRTLLTCHHAFHRPPVSPAAAGAEAESDETNTAPLRKVTALPLAQEISTNPCDVGSEPAVLRAEYGDLRDDGAGWLDAGELERGWNDKTSAASPYAPRPERLEARARAARRWLRDLGRNHHHHHHGGGRLDAEIVVVTHGGFLHFLTQDWDGMDIARGTGWENTEWRSYEFVNPYGDDEEASIRETAASWQRRRGSAKPLTETEQQQARAAVIAAMRTTWLEPDEQEQKTSSG